MCMLIEGKNIMTGWGCCRCMTYNGLHRDRCKWCGEPHHETVGIEARQDDNRDSGSRES